MIFISADFFAIQKPVHGICLVQGAIDKIFALRVREHSGEPVSLSAKRKFVTINFDV